MTDGTARHGLPAVAWRGWSLLAIVLAMWEVLRRLFSVSPLVMPPLVEILGVLIRDLHTGPLAGQLLRSLSVIAVAGGGAVALAVVVVPVAATNRWFGEFLRLAASLLHPLPGIALLPVIILWFGVGTTAVAVIIVHSVFWPVVTNLQAGYRALPRVWRQLAVNYRLGTWQYLLRIALPGTLPYLLAGLRIAWARSWRALISAEMVFGALAGGGGLGWYVYNRRVFMDAQGLFAGILLVMVVGSLVESVLFSLLERRTVQRWGMSS